ncbi:tetratricopeptide repeat protein [Thiomonas sp.]
MPALPANIPAIRETFAAVATLEDLRLLMNDLRDPAFTIQALYPNDQRKPMAAAVWREYVQALRRFPLTTWAQLLPFLVLAEFVGSLRVYGAIPDEELKAARYAMIHNHLPEQGITAWLTGLTLTSLYDADMVPWLQHSVALEEPALRPVTLSWMTMAWTCLGTITRYQHRNREFLFQWLTTHAEETQLFIPQSAFLDAYWSADPAHYAGLRGAFARWAESRGIVNHPVLDPAPGQRPRIGFVSGNWREHHSVRKALHTSVQALRAWADVFLVDTNLRQDSVSGDFDGVLRVTATADPDAPGVSRIDDRALADARLDLLYFAETFQAEIDTLLAMRRYAPIQATGYGIPVTTRSPHMDWFIGGTLVEGKGARDYSERVLLVPGIGMHSTRREPGPSLEKAPGELRVVVAANLQKLTAEYLETLARIAAAVPDARWIFLPNATTVAGLWAGDEVRAIMGTDRMSWYPQVRDLYQPIIRSADLVLDAIPYSGYTTVVDAVSCATPILTWQGRHAHERTAAAVARQGGMPRRWVARDYADFERKAVQLLRSPLARQICRLRLQRHAERVFDETQADALSQALRAILAQGGEPGTGILDRRPALRVV